MDSMVTMSVDTQVDIPSEQVHMCIRHAGELKWRIGHHSKVIIEWI